MDVTTSNPSKKLNGTSSLDLNKQRKISAFVTKRSDGLASEKDAKSVTIHSEI